MGSLRERKDLKRLGLDWRKILISELKYLMRGSELY